MVRVVSSCDARRRRNAFYRALLKAIDAARERVLLTTAVSLQRSPAPSSFVITSHEFPRVLRVSVSSVPNATLQRCNGVGGAATQQ
jgi:hypothetical protein